MSGLKILPRRSFYLGNKFRLSHSNPAIASYVTSLQSLQAGPFKFQDDPEHFPGIVFGVIVNFALHVMPHSERALVFGDPGPARRIIVEGNDDKRVLFSLGRSSVLSWIRAIARHPKAFGQWFANHMITRVRAHTLMSDQVAPIGTIAISNLNDPSDWAYQLEHNARLARGGLIIGSGAPAQIEAFVGHLEQSGRLFSAVKREFTIAAKAWSICICQLEAI